MVRFLWAGFIIIQCFCPPPVVLNQIDNESSILWLSFHPKLLLFFRLAYPVYKLMQMERDVQAADKGIRLHVMYDVACTLSRHLQGS